MRNYYLSASGPIGLGDGSTAANAADASTQVKLDAIWLSFFGVAVNFFYAAGLYQTNGFLSLNNSRQTAQNNQGHFGAGMNSTTIQLINASSLTSDGIIFANNLNSTKKLVNFQIKDMTLDCNATNQPKWTGAGGAVGAIILIGGENILIQRVKIINFGTATIGRECFPCAVFGVSGQGGLTMTNVVIDSCVFTSPVSGNKDGVSCCTISDSVPDNVQCDATCVISNCTFTNCFNATTGQPGDFSFQHCYGAPTCVNNTATNCDIGFYQEPPFPGGTLNNVQINVIGNTLTNVNKGAYVSMHNGSTMGALTISSDTYSLNSSGVGVRIVGSGGSIANLKSLTVQGCKMTTAGGVNTVGVIVNEGATDLAVQVVSVINTFFSGFGGSNTSFNMALIKELHIVPPLTVGQSGVYVVVTATGAKIVADLVAGPSYYGQLQSVTSGPYPGYTAAIAALVSGYNVE